MNQKEETIRCFVAIDLPPALKEELALLIENLRQVDKSRRVKWVRPEGIHLTLKFLGEVPALQVPDIISATGAALARPEIKPFGLLVGKIGVFPKPDAPRVIWVGLDGNLKALEATYQAVENALVGLGFPPEKRDFSPHLTLGRVPDIGPQEKRFLGQNLLKYPGKTGFGSFNFGEAVLMQSELQPAGAIYTPLAHFKFGERQVSN
jgi:2'-5' RNA ligase